MCVEWIHMIAEAGKSKFAQPMSQFESQGRQAVIQPGRVKSPSFKAVRQKTLLFGGGSSFGRTQFFNQLDEVHPLEGEPSSLCSLATQMLISSQNNIMGAPRIMFDQTPGH